MGLSRFGREQALTAVESHWPVPASHRRQQQLIYKFMKRHSPVSLSEEQAHALQKAARDRLVIALGIGVHSAHAFVETPDDVRQLLVEVDVGPAQLEVCRRGEMRFVRPVLTLK